MLYRQPQIGPASVNWSHPLLKGCHAISSGAHIHTRSGYTSNTTTIGSTQLGLYSSVTFPYIKELDASSTKTVHLFSKIGRRANTASYAAYISYGYYIGVTDQQLVQIGDWGALNTDARNYRHNADAVTTYTDTLSDPILNTSIELLLDDNGTGLLSTFVGGVSQGTSIRSGAAFTNDTRKVISFDSALFGFAFDRSVGNADRESLLSNPWQVFVDPNDEIFVAAAASNTGVGSAAFALTATGIGSSQYGGVGSISTVLTAVSTGKSIFNGVGSISTTITVSGIGKSISASAGSVSTILSAAGIGSYLGVAPTLRSGVGAAIMYSSMLGYGNALQAYTWTGVTPPTNTWTPITDAADIWTAVIVPTSTII